MREAASEPRQRTKEIVRRVAREKVQTWPEAKQNKLSKMSPELTHVEDSRSLLLGTSIADRPDVMSGPK